MDLVRKYYLETQPEIGIAQLLWKFSEQSSGIIQTGSIYEMMVYQSRMNRFSTVPEYVHVSSAEMEIILSYST